MKPHKFAFQNRIDTLCEWGAIAAAACLFVLALMISYEVLVRYGFGHSTGWVQELSVYLMMASGFLAAAYALQHHSHFAITFFVDRLSAEKRRRLNMLTHSMGLLYSGIFVVQGVNMAWFSHQLNDTSTGLLEVPLWIPALLVPIGGLLLLLQFLNQFIDLMVQGESQ